MADKQKKIGKVVVDRNLCIGAASCVVAAGEVFELDAENKAVMKLKGSKKTSNATMKQELEAESINDETLLMAAQSCPTRAIFLYDEDGKQVYP